MKRLIINADDLGADESRNDGIFEAIAADAVTSISILPNGPALANALGIIRSLNLDRVSPGIHVNLSEGRPLSSGLKFLIGSDGCFLGKKGAQRLLMRSGDSNLEEEISRELKAQIAALQNAGLRINHLDGHQHVHVFPAVVRLATEVAKAHAIPWIRIPAELENECQTGSLPSAVLEEAHFFNGHAEAARSLLPASGLFSTDHFRGLYLKGRLPASNWMEFLETIPPGLTEFMVHPGHAAANSASGPFSGFSTSDREMELKALTDENFRKALVKTGVVLTPFPEGRNPI
jgi:chitin disaccharide deacetylase